MSSMTCAQTHHGAHIPCFVMILIFFSIFLLFHASGECQSGNADSATPDATLTPSPAPVDEESSTLTKLKEHIDAESDANSAAKKQNEKQIVELQSRLAKIKDQDEKADLENRILTLREIDRHRDYFLILLRKELDIRQQLSSETNPESEEESLTAPTTTEGARDLVNELNLLKNREMLSGEKIASLNAELEVKKAQEKRNRDAESIRDSNEPPDQLHKLQKSVLTQEITVTTLQIDDASRKLDSLRKKIARYQEIVDSLDPLLLSSSEEEIRRRERQTRRMQKLEDEQKISLTKDREKLNKDIAALEKSVRDNSAIIDKSETDERERIWRTAKNDALAANQNYLQLRLKLVNWKQKLSETKVLLEQQRLEIENLILEVKQGSADSGEMSRINSLISSTIEEIEKQKEFYSSRAAVYQKETEQQYLLLDQLADSIDTLQEQVDSGADPVHKKVLRERMNQEEFLRQTVTIEQELKDLMNQFTFHYELQRLKWQEVANLLPSFGRSWLRMTVLGTEITMLQLIQFFIAILATLIIARMILYFTSTKLAAWTQNDKLVTIFEKPFRFLVITIGIYLATKLLSFDGSLGILVSKLFDTLIIVNISYMLIKITDFLTSLLDPIVARTETKLDDQLIPIIRKSAKIFIVIISSIILIERLGYPVTSIIAGLGIGGLAFALAAKDTIANLFGSVVIFADRPFQIGDWVIIAGSEGVVEEVGVRSTKIRTFSDTLITIPNNAVANETIQNISAFRNRRVYIKLGITYDAGPDGADRAVQIIRQVLDDNPRVKDGHYIFFDDFNDSSLNMMVYYFVKSTVWREYLTVRQEVNVEIMRRFAAEGISFAFPTRMIEFAQGTPSPASDGISIPNEPPPSL